MATSENVESANRRARELQASVPRAISAHYDPASGRVVIHLSSRLDVSFLPEDAQGLENATPSQLGKIEISPSGLGIHFPEIDADIYLPALLEGFLGSRQWMASRLGQTGGRSKSAAKRAAAKANGLTGGRPRKTVNR